MRYRRFPKIEDLEVSALGLGTMRLPTRSADPADIDEEKADAILRAAVEAGVNYVDTAYPYHRGESEKYLGRAFRRTGLRDKFYLASKSPVWLVKEPGDWDRILDEQLERLGTDHLDFYLLHALGAERWENVKRHGGLEAMARAKAQGKIRHLGFSFHDSRKVFKEIVDAYEGWEFCQVQYNYMDEDFQAGGEGIAYAAAREIGVIVMEPLRGGALARVPRAVKEIFGKYRKPRLPAEWALRYVLERQEVATVLSGMGKVEELWENVGIAEAAAPNSLTREELSIVAEARAFFKEREKVPCTSCGYCKPCPSKVSIPEIFNTYNTAAVYDDRPGRSAWYDTMYLKGGTGVDRCTRCGACLPKCPQGIAIPDRLAEAHAYLAEGRA